MIAVIMVIFVLFLIENTSNYLLLHLALAFVFICHMKRMTHIYFIKELLSRIDLKFYQNEREKSGAKRVRHTVAENLPDLATRYRPIDLRS